MARDQRGRPDYAHLMEDVTVPKLRDRLDELLDRVEAGETIRITREGRAIAEMRPTPDPAGPSIEELKEIRRRLPPTDLEEFRRDLDAIFDPRL